MSIIYGAFCIAIGISMALNFLTRSKKEKVDPTTVPWMFIGAAYFGMFIVMAISNTSTTTNIYVFQVLSTIGLAWYIRALEFKFIFVSIPFSIGIPAFVTAWTTVAYFAGADEFSMLLPSTVSMTIISFMIAIYYFIRSDEEVLLKNVIGGLFTAYGLSKILYIIDAEIQDPIFYIGLFVLDYLIYLIISFLLFFNNHYKKITMKNRKFVIMKEIINEAPIGFVTLNRDGDIIVANSFVEDKLQAKGVKSGTIYDLFDTFPIVDKYYYQVEWKRILVALDMRQRYFKSRQVHGEINYDFQFDFHLVDIYSSNKAEIFLNIYQRELENPEFKVLEHGDYVDSLTGLPSKIEMEKLFDLHIKEEKDNEFAVILMSIGNYREMVKYIGGELAEEFMAILNTYIEEVDQIASIGKISADTFELFTKGLKKGQIVEVVNDLMQNLQIPFKHKDYDIETKPLLGIAMYPENGKAHGELLKGAQIALAKAEYTKMGQVQYCTIEYMKASNDPSSIERHLSSALENEEFHLVFQPQYDTANEIFRGFEALIRWENDELDSISPNLFIPIAEEMGIMNEIGQWVLEHAIEKAAAWQRSHGLSFIISVNVSGMQLEKAGFAEYIAIILERYDYNPRLLELEITETRLVKSNGSVFKELKLIKDMGIKIALDDFGTGYSSLDYLRWLPFDVLKIDKSFIDHMNNDSIEREIVNSVINLVSKMDLETIAEGVENTDQLQSLQSSNCTYIQGYLFSKPLNYEEAEKIIIDYNK